MTEACSLRTGDFNSVQWYVVPNAETLQLDGETVHGYWIGAPDRIVLTDRHHLDGPLVRHEMLHALLQMGSHPRESFLTSCDGVVACDGKCNAETGGRADPPATALQLHPRDVATHVEFVPRSPTMSGDSGAVAVFVEITNPSAEPAWVNLTPLAPGDPDSPTFGIIIDYDDPAQIGTASYIWITGSRFPLGPRESRRFVWDWDLPVGRYGVRGLFNVDTATRVILEVGH